MNPETITLELDRITRSGKYWATGWHKHAPILDLQGLGPLPLPIVPALLPALRGQAEPAPYGRGPDTLVDPAVRLCHQIHPARVSLPSRWEATVAAITDEAAAQLGVTGVIDARLYKVLIYGPGDFFVPHRDTEKEAGMFGTLVVTLPGDFTGGELVVRHGGHEQVLDLNAGRTGVRWAAFYADCTHEIQALKTGARVALVYNLVHTTAQPAPAPIEGVVGRLAEELRSWTDQDPVKLVWLLEHRYSKAELGWGRLKGADHGRAHALQQAAVAVGAVVHLTLVKVDIEWSAEELQYRSRGRGSRRGGYVDGAAPPADLELYDLVRDDREVRCWVDIEDRATGDEPLPLEAGEVWPEGRLDAEAPDHVSYYEATGNEGASLTRAYRRAAVVIWPARNHDAVVAQRGIEAVVALLAHVQDSGRAKALVRRVLPLVRSEAHEVVARLLDRLMELGLTTTAARVLEKTRPWTSRLDGALASLLPALDSARAGALGASALAGMTWEEKSAVAALKGANGTGHPASTWWPMLDLAAEKLDRWTLTGAQVADLVEVASDLGHGRLLQTLVAWTEDEGNFDLAVDAALELDLRDTCPPEWRDLIVQRLEEKTAEAPQPLGLARRPVATCRCAHCAVLSAFLVDPEQESLSYGVRQDLRQHLAGKVRSERMDVDTREERSGNPYQIVFTKVNLQVQAAIRRYEEHVDALEALRGGGAR